MNTFTQDAEFAADCSLLEISNAIVRLEQIRRDHPGVIAARAERMAVAVESLRNVIKAAYDGDV